MPYSAIKPSRAKVELSFASDLANRKSALMAITKPKPAAGPLIAVITGVDRCKYFPGTVRWL